MIQNLKFLFLFSDTIYPVYHASLQLGGLHAFAVRWTRHMQRLAALDSEPNHTIVQEWLFSKANTPQNSQHMVLLAPLRLSDSFWNL